MMMNKYSPEGNFGGQKTIKSGNIWWVKEDQGVIIIDIQRKIYWLLVGLEQDLWQMIALHVPYDFLIETVERTLDLSKKASQEIITHHITHWINEGIVQVCDQ
jgi:hypothetical protein